MVALTEQEQQVVSLFQRLPPERRRLVILEMARTDPDGWKRLRPLGEQRLRELAAARGKSWERMDDQQRQDFVVELLDEGGQ